MSKHMKKLISTLLCGAMLLSSLPLAFAEGETAPAADAAAPAAEATAAPEASAAPIADTTAIAATAQDDYFDEAIGLLSKLGIFEGYEDGSIKPESTITRTEMAAVILRTLGNKSLTKYANTFSDVDASHWGADTIQTAADKGIINGMGDGTFAPDAPVTYEQAVKMTVCALNYGAYADYHGGYPMGYIQLASRKDMQLLKNIGGAVNTPATRGTVVKLIYNALNAPYPTLSGFDSQGPIYSTEDDKTLASEMHKVYISKGVLTATYNKSIDVGSNLLESQISIDGDIFESEIKNGDELVGQYVKAYYYDPTGNGGEEKVIYAVPVLNKNNTLTVDAKDIDTFKDWDTKTPKLSYYNKNNSKKSAKIVEDPIVVYNNEVLTVEGFERYRNAIIEQNKKLSDEEKVDVPTYEDFITPDVGFVKLGDFDNDGYYDIVFVEKYLTIVVNSASEKKVTFKDPVDGYKSMDMDLEDSKYKIDLTRDGEKIKPRHLREYNILSVMMNAPYLDPSYTGDRKIKAVATTATLSGRATSYNEEDDNWVTYIDGKKYYVDKNAQSDLDKAVGTDAVFYLDQFDRIAYVDKSGSGKLSGSEKYGWIINVYMDDGADSPTVRMYTMEGAVKEFELDSTIDYWDKNGHEKSFKVTDDINSEDSRLLSLGNKAKTSGYESMVGGPGMSIRLCRYKVNSNDLISKFYIATVTDDEDALTVDATCMKNKDTTGSTLNGMYNMSKDVIEFRVPNSENDLTDYDTYSVGTIAGTKYFNYKDGASEEFVVAEFDDNRPGVIVTFLGGSDVVKNPDDYNTADDNSVMMVSKILKAVDDDDETVYVVKGFIGAGEVSFTTKTVSVLRWTTNPAGGENKLYPGDTIWDGKSGKNLADYLKPGDIVGVAGGGEIFIKFVDIDTVKADVLEDGDFALDKTHFYGSFRKSETRDNMAFGYVTGVTIDTSAAVSTMDGAKNTALREISLDSAITYAEVSKDGTVKIKDGDDALSPFDIEEFDTKTKTGDFVYKRLHKNGAERETYVIRFVD